MAHRSLTLALLATSFAFSANAFDAVTLADYSGAEIFQRYCAACHGESAHGDGPAARSLKAIVPDLTKIELRDGEFPAAAIRDTIDGRGVQVPAHGTRAMPVWGRELWMEDGGDVTAEKEMRAAIKRLVEYLRSIQVPKDAAR
ncbi:MAG: cytochrome c [Gammaproteobacteria bacterium]